MRFSLLACVASLVVVASPAFATIPTLNASCPGGIDVHADQGGPVYVNGKHAKLHKFSPTYYEAKSGQVTISITFMEDGTVDVSYTGPGRANGVCQIVVYHGGAEDGGCPVDVSEADRYKYPACN